MCAIAAAIPIFVRTLQPASDNAMGMLMAARANIKCFLEQHPIERTAEVPGQLSGTLDCSPPYAVGCMGERFGTPREQAGIGGDGVGEEEEEDGDLYIKPHLGGAWQPSRQHKACQTE